jgi:hypothetical protein
VNRPELDDAFGHWLAGFADGEGCFSIIRTVGQLAEFFTRYPLRAKKRTDFAIWRQAVELWIQRRRRNGDWDAIGLLATELSANRNKGLDDAGVTVEGVPMERELRLVS